MAARPGEPRPPDLGVSFAPVVTGSRAPLAAAPVRTPDESVPPELEKALAPLLKRGFALGKLTANKGYFGLVQACKVDLPDAALALLQTSCSTESRDPVYGFTPLMHAAGSNSDQVVEVLMKARADLEAEDISGRTALVHAALWGSTRCIDVLLRGGCNLWCRAVDGLSAAHVAAQVGQVVGMLEILNRFGSRWPVDDKGRTVLMHACAHGQVSCAKALLDCKADPWVEDGDGHTASLHALLSSHYDCVVAIESVSSAGTIISSPVESEGMLGIKMQGDGPEVTRTKARIKLEDLAFCKRVV
eukprot:CAMPEP_0204328930 /NCGR_PEP_ID=MMETSP0469-20131031/13776_1 /ASSEMBLY_ACC=CAM_ASM_000384 /TAXON_ID=2969 /ORGANISM="Oxyrrhis marina" /LENGTH=301 /DNA_ID=CAMNT_0051311447 /DNA_START=9 /DNA_END=914 /DNA_ORIENTATION=+